MIRVRVQACILIFIILCCAAAMGYVIETQVGDVTAKFWLLLLTGGGTSGLVGAVWWVWTKLIREIEEEETTEEEKEQAELARRLIARGF